MTSNKSVPPPYHILLLYTYLFLPGADDKDPEKMAMVLHAGRRSRREAEGVPWRAAGHASFRRLFCQGSYNSCSGIPPQVK